MSVYNFREKAKMEPKQSKNHVRERPLDIDGVRLVSDLHIMHSKVNELCAIVRDLKKRYSKTQIEHYADQEMLSQEIQQVDEIYLWFVKLKEEQRQKRA